MDIEKCIEFMKIKHGDQRRKQGTLYYTHPLAVSKILKEKGFDDKFIVAGLFHDLLEDTDATEKEILELSNEDVLMAVKLVTKENGYDMNDYIERINNNEIAKMVKIVDRIHNLSEAIYADLAFKLKYIKETEKYYIDLAKGTIFENDLKFVLENLKDGI